IVRAHQPSAHHLPDTSYRRLLAPLDGSQRAECALSLATTLAMYVPQGGTNVTVFAYVALSIVVLAGAVGAVLSRNALRAAVALGAGSAALASLFFLLNAPYAGGFELSIGAGLVSVLFIIAISLTESMQGQQRET
ncbi:MAG TPA: NADH-quinone oxidoreductase subunit J, partial [Anaerolineae bacterium]|nr:NADH-quinone oxidoreductase subunit J [Anaerolineae bacterium]